MSGLKLRYVRESTSDLHVILAWYHRWVVAGTTIWSGLSYVGRKGVNIIKK